MSLLTRDPASVIVAELSPAQIACLELKVGAYRHIDHAGLLELVGAVQSDRRPALYAELRGSLSASSRAFWDARPQTISVGIGTAGKFERYFELFRNWVLPLIHDRQSANQPHSG